MRRESDRSAFKGGHRRRQDAYSALLANRLMRCHARGAQPERVERPDEVESNERLVMLERPRGSVTLDDSDSPALACAVHENPQGARCSALSSAASKATTSVTSAAANEAYGPSSRLNFSPSDVGRSTRTVFTPRATRRSAVARPSPEAPPVTTAEAFVRSTHSS